MAGNGLINASGLDGASGWTALSGAMSVDETSRGGPGRAVLIATRSATVGQTTGLRSVAVAVVAGAQVEVAGLYGSNGASELALAIYSGATLLSRTVVTRRRTAIGVSRMGVPERLNAAYDLIAASHTGDAKLEVLATAGGSGSLEAWLSKPYLDGTWQERPTYVWDPGSHANADLSGLRVWPASLPPVLLEGFDAQPTPLRSGWVSDGGRELTQRMAGSSATQMRGRMSLSLEQLTVLEAFNEDSEEAFLFVRPDTQQLCLAQWLADGAPASAPNGAGRHYASFGLQLDVL